MTQSPFQQPVDNIIYARDRRVLLIAGDGGGRANGEEAIALAGCRLTGRLDWPVAADHMADALAFDVVLVEAEGADSEQLALILPGIDTMARRAEARVVVALSVEQIDLVTAALFGAHTQLLCAPSLAERVAALSIAGAATPAARLNDSASEAESARLRRLNEEVARIAETLAQLTRRDGALPIVDRADRLGDRRPGYNAAPTDDAIAIDAGDIRRAIRARRLRDQYFESGLFEDPGWDMLLDLFAAELEARQVSVSSLCIAAAVAPTTALRWIGKMSEAGLFEREPDPFDRRRAFMALSDTAREGMHRYCRAVGKSGLSIA
jgi:hypothetical protein